MFLTESLNSKCKIIILGEKHYNKKDREILFKLLDKFKPDVFLTELLYEDEVHTKEEAQSRLSLCKRDDQYINTPNNYEKTKCLIGWNEDMYKVTIKYGIPSIGIDLDQPINESLSKKFFLRETRMLAKIKEYENKVNKILVLVGDTHLRTVKTQQLGSESLLWLYYKDNPNVKIIRSKYKEID